MTGPHPAKASPRIIEYSAEVYAVSLRVRYWLIAAVAARGSRQIRGRRGHSVHLSVICCSDVFAVLCQTRYWFTSQQAADIFLQSILG